MNELVKQIAGSSNDWFNQIKTNCTTWMIIIIKKVTSPNES